LLAALTPEDRQRLLEITTTEVDRLERQVTKHDVRAFNELFAQRLPEHASQLVPWVHFGATSFDKRDTATALMFKTAHREVVSPSAKRLIGQLAEFAENHLNTLQIGRTHGQHAIPITVGFWVATILYRLLSCAHGMDERASEICGKFSGAVGAYNAQALFGLTAPDDKESFEWQVLSRLGLHPASISTQIVPPETLARYLHEVVLFSGALAQFGEDCRQLMRTEIGEIAETTAAGQSGSSTMFHKQNPITFENICGLHRMVVNEYQHVIGNLVSEHQRDLTGSSISRQYPAVVVLMQQQLEAAIRVSSRLVVSKQALGRNFAMKSHVIMAEAAQLALKQAGFPGDIHEFVTNRLVNNATSANPLGALMSELLTREYPEIIRKIPKSVLLGIAHPEEYLGYSAETAFSIISYAKQYASLS
jgi:adenylosuccinate lyase